MRKDLARPFVNVSRRQCDQSFGICNPHGCTPRLGAAGIVHCVVSAAPGVHRGTEEMCGCRSPAGETGDGRIWPALLPLLKMCPRRGTYILKQKRESQTDK